MARPPPRRPFNDAVDLTAIDSDVLQFAVVEPAQRGHYGAATTPIDSRGSPGADQAPPRSRQEKDYSLSTQRSLGRKLHR
jgi:hypothetical protein